MPPCFPICSSMWSKKPSPVEMSHLPFPSKLMRTSMSVSFVVRFTSAMRSPAKRNSAMRSQSVVARAHVFLSSSFSSRDVSGCNRIARHPKFLASSTSVARSPMTKLPARSYSSLSIYRVSIPVLGLRVGALSSGNERSMQISSKVMPSLAKVFSIRLCTGQNVSSGKESVPNPSWLVTITNSKSSLLRIKYRFRNTFG